jgi:hypothetical protein
VLGTTTRVNLGPAGAQANGSSTVTSDAVSDDGRYVAFTSTATNLVSNDANGAVADVFVRDLAAATTEVASLTRTGAQSGADPTNALLSGDGRYVVFQCSNTCGILPGVGISTAIFVRDRVLGTVEEVSVWSTGEEVRSSVFVGGISTDGLHIGFATNACAPGLTCSFGAFDFYVRDVATHTTERASVASSGAPANDSSITSGQTIGAEGRFVLFSSTATNLVVGDTNLRRDLFLRDRGVTRVSDTTPPTVGCGPADDTWHGGDVTVTCKGSDADSGLANASDASFELSTSVAAGTEDAHAFTNGRQVCDVVGNCAAAAPVGPFRIDRKAPAVTCHVPPDVVWHSTNVSILCEATDSGAGLADNLDQFFSLATSVAPGTEDAAATTSTHEVCDTVGNCATGGPYSLMIDRKPPAIVFVSRSPAPNADGWNNGAVTLTWSCADTGSGVVESTTTRTVAGEGAGQSATGTCFDSAGNSASDTRTGINVDLTGPVTQTPILAANPKPVSQSTAISADAADALSGISYGELYVETDPGPGHGSPLALGGSQLTGTIGASLAPGVYSVCARGRDRAGNWGGAACTLLVVYDPAGGFVTGSGSIESPQGAYRPNPSLFGRAQFGFVSKYKQGETTPTGNTRFEFKVAGFDFQSTSYDWLVVSGTHAQFKGSGTVNGSGDYAFMVTVFDGDVTGGGKTDAVRIKVWDKANGGGVVYDNQLGAADGADPTTVISTGSIVIHKA